MNKLILIAIISQIVFVCEKASCQLTPAYQASSVTKISDEIISKANQGSPFYQFVLGKCYLYGRGTNKNYEEAVKWLEKSASQKNPGALNSLGICYYNGFGVRQDFEKAVEYFKSSSDYGDSWAFLNLAVCYEKGKGVKKDLKESQILFTQAEQRGLFRK